MDPKKSEPPVIRRQGSSADGEAIKIVIDDVDSTTAKDNNKIQSSDVSELRTRVIRLRRDAQDRGYQSKSKIKYKHWHIRPQNFLNKEIRNAG